MKLVEIKADWHAIIDKNGHCVGGGYGIPSDLLPGESFRWFDTLAKMQEDAAVHAFNSEVAQLAQVDKTPTESRQEIYALKAVEAADFLGNVKKPAGVIDRSANPFDPAAHKILFMEYRETWQLMQWDGWDLAQRVLHNAKGDETIQKEITARRAELALKSSR